MSKIRDYNDWLAYSIEPRQLRTALRPAMWGNGQLELLADLDRPCVSEVVCFDFKEEGLWYSPASGGVGGEEHQVPAIYAADTGKKYLLHSAASSAARKVTVTFRPDRQIWRYDFDDLVVDLSLILPRLHPGYLLKLQIVPKSGNHSQKWLILHELRGFHGSLLRATEAEYDLTGGSVWCKSPERGHGEAIGATVDAERVNLGWDGQFACDMMATLAVERASGNQPTQVYLARAFGAAMQDARDSLAKLLDSPEKLESDSEEWWNHYLNEVPRLETPDEPFSKNFLWSWANFRMSRIDVSRGRVPAGLFYSNNTHISVDCWLAAGGDQAEAEAIQVLHDPKPAHDHLLFMLRETRKQGILSPGFWAGKELPGGRIHVLGHLCGLVHKYVSTTGDFDLLAEDIGDGLTILERLEDALEAQLPYRDDNTGLFWTDDDVTAWIGPGGLGPAGETINRYRGHSDVFCNHHNAAMFGTFLVLADLEELAGNQEKSSRYRQLAEAMRQAIQERLWSEEHGFFCDLHRDGSVTDYRGIGGFWTGLFANHIYRPGGLATKEQAERLAAWCNHPDFVSDFGTVSLARSHSHFDPADYKGFSGAFDMHWCNQVTAGLYAHGQHEEAHRQLFKLFRRLGENAGLGPRYRGEAYHADTGEILPWRFMNYPCILSALTSVIEGVFGLRWTKDALTAYVNSPWPWAKLRNLRFRESLLDLELMSDGSLAASINGKEVARSPDGKLELSWELFA